jgi:hypothetical protein
MSRRRRVLLWAGLLVVLAGTGVVGIAWLTNTASTGKLSRTRFDLLSIGMPKTEVIEILGEPFLDAKGGKGVPHVLWITEVVFVDIVFDDGDHLLKKEWLDSIQPSLLDRFRRWLGL